MRTNSDLTRLGARMKLVKRHLLELKTLLDAQRVVRCSIQHSISGQFILNQATSPTAAVIGIAQQAIRLNRLNRSHSQERQELAARHQQEDTDLEKVFDNYKNGAMPKDS